ncbi:DUF819 domain-containing protein [Atopobacter sp. AH10]|uniref:DUF819 family protein n=1 Tax=Atopobacter sp. AH10 TaxID=2315861 RepID=UPI000EF288F8|nr:DUF819 family protein [Atopobacter sp. AH10]RLK62965.1 DUF819 domain-containing protein [Atopobacter sp. AH10]
MPTFIAATDTWTLWAILAVSASAAIILEQKYEWASRITGCILALLFMLVLANLRIIPTESPVYDTVWSYVVPLAVPMLLLSADFKNLKRDAGRLLIIFLMSSVGTLIGGFLAYYALKNFIPQLNTIVPMFVGTYIGGSVNFVALSTVFHVSGQTTSAALVADNLLGAVFFSTIIALPTLGFIRRHYSHPYIDTLEKMTEEEKNAHKTQAAKYWSAKEISLKDIALTVSIAFVIVAISSFVSGIFEKTFTGKDPLSQLIANLLGNKYLMITTFTWLAATFSPIKLSSIRGSQEIGTFLIYLFFAVIGAPASISLILKESPLLLVFAAIIVGTNLIVSLLLGKLFNFSIEEILIASNANVGGPTTAAAMAVSKGWNELIVPALLVGTFGYVIGNYLGIIVGTALQ